MRIGLEYTVIIDYCIIQYFKIKLMFLHWQMLDERAYRTQVKFGSCGILRQVSSKNCFGALLFKHLRLIEFYFWTDGLVLLVWLLQRSPFCWTKTTSLFLAFLFFGGKSFHWEMVWNFVLSLSLPTFHYWIIAFWQRILRPVVSLWKLSQRDTPLLITRPVWRLCHLWLQILNSFLSL